jgi:hypothetical protein
MTQHIALTIIVNLSLREWKKEAMEGFGSQLETENRLMPLQVIALRLSGRSGPFETLPTSGTPLLASGSEIVRGDWILRRGIEIGHKYVAAF